VCVCVCAYLNSMYFNPHLLRRSCRSLSANPTAAQLSFFLTFFRVEYPTLSLKAGLGLDIQTCVFSGIHFKKYFIEFVCVQTNEVVRSNSKVILTRQTCSQRSSRVAGSKRRALALYFPIRIGYVFLVSECRGESDLCMCMT